MQVFTYFSRPEAEAEDVSTGIAALSDYIMLLRLFFCSQLVECDLPKVTTSSNIQQRIHLRFIEMICWSCF